MSNCLFFLLGDGTVEVTSLQSLTTGKAPRTAFLEAKSSLPSHSPPFLEHRSSFGFSLDEFVQVNHRWKGEVASVSQWRAQGTVSSEDMFPFSELAWGVKERATNSLLIYH